MADRGIGQLESQLNAQFIPRGHSFLIRADSHEKLDFIRRLLDKLSGRFEDNPAYVQEVLESEGLVRNLKNEINNEIKGGNKNENGAPENSENGDRLKAASKSQTEDLLKEKIYTTYRGKSLFPRTLNQALYIQSIVNNAVTFCLGPAGTGKTFLAIAAACHLLQTGKVERIILTRPAVEAGESLGYLPGDLNQKVDPYLRPVYDALYECLGLEKVTDFIQSRKIEIAPLAYMRGRTLNHSVIVLDEAQNCTLSQLKMFLTRLGKKFPYVSGRGRDPGGPDARSFRSDPGHEITGPGRGHWQYYVWQRGYHSSSAGRTNCSGF